MPIELYVFLVILYVPFMYLLVRRILQDFVSQEDLRLFSLFVLLPGVIELALFARPVMDMHLTLELFLIGVLFVSIIYCLLFIFLPIALAKILKEFWAVTRKRIIIPLGVKMARSSVVRTICMKAQLK